ncbi:pyridoxamine 5-phosphate oxidase [Halovulum dunhuangense]|uniref:Pyridoxamine 5-phosphate oxidase n=1 Tax=Halovulum dunhuangense TaxID=1505036 RepID=A0A849L3Z1_9RHOB|nr:pyridoxamine 5'-phosphate oxidase family protein [Halovulum dunhuangense]NNU80912.1 pyridoxamine 5-phosphate oxidase [Halovulum dunhuangense]
MSDPRDPFRPADDEARALAARLLAVCDHAALGVIDAATGAPFVTRIAFCPADDGTPMTLVSDLAPHTAALHANPAASLLLASDPGKGDPLTHPRLTLQVRARFVGRTEPGHPALRAQFLARRPKAGLYIDFGDFHLVRLAVHEAHLNGGFGKAYRLAPSDLGLAGP